MGRIVRLISGGIGLASEAIATRRSRSQSPSRSAGAGSSRDIGRSDEAPPQYVEVPDERADELIAKGQAIPVDQKEKKGLSDDDDSSDSGEDDEIEWDLDDAAEEIDPPSYNESTANLGTDGSSEEGQREIVETFLRSVPRPPSRISKLPCPVVIPQRRPREKGRGFIRAYAPVLNDCGIDQDTFLRFLKTFHQASKASFDPCALYCHCLIQRIGFWCLHHYQLGRNGCWLHTPCSRDGGFYGCPSRCRGCERASSKAPNELLS